MTPDSGLDAPVAAPLGHKLIISYGQRASDAQPKPIECSWPEFVAWLQSHPRTLGDKDGPYICLAYFNGRRSLDTLIHSSGVPLDFDKGLVTADVIAATLHGYSYVAYTTYGHQPGA